MTTKSHEHHIVPLKTFLGVFGILIFLTVITVVAAQFDFGVLNTVVAMGIASLKAFFVLAYFMHLKYDDKIFVVCFSLALFFLLVMYLFSAIDVWTRLNVNDIL